MNACSYLRNSGQVSSSDSGKDPHLFRKVLDIKHLKSGLLNQVHRCDSPYETELNCVFIWTVLLGLSVISTNCIDRPVSRIVVSYRSEEEDTDISTREYTCVWRYCFILLFFKIFLVVVRESVQFPINNPPKPRIRVKSELTSPWQPERKVRFLW